MSYTGNGIRIAKFPFDINHYFKLNVLLYKSILTGFERQEVYKLFRTPIYTRYVLLGHYLKPCPLSYLRQALSCKKVVYASGLSSWLTLNVVCNDRYVWVKKRLRDIEKKRAIRKHEEKSIININIFNMSQYEM